MATPFKVLSDLLVAHFTTAELSRILQDQGKDNLRFAIAWGNPPATVIADLVDGLRRYNEADLVFFQALLDVRPNVAGAIREAAAAWIPGEVGKLSAKVSTAGAGPKGPAEPLARVTPAALDRGDLIIIRHQPRATPQFQVWAGEDLLHETDLQSPDDLQVSDTPFTLSAGIRWLLETSYRARTPSTVVDSAVRKALKSWGEETFRRLMGSVDAGLSYGRLRNAGLIDVRVVSSDPRVMAWPWEAVRDPSGFEWAVSRNIRVSRGLSIRMERGQRPMLPQDRVHVLLVTARPYESDVEVQSVSGPIVDALSSAQGGASADVTLLRPPTLEALEAALSERPGHYQVVHFDGHGAVSNGNGALVFEDDASRPDPVSAEVLAQTLLRLDVSVVVLNACRSATLGGTSEDAFAAVATSLLRAGVGAVVAMSYNLHVDGAVAFVPAFYRDLFLNGDPLKAAAVGRLNMSQSSTRRGAMGPVNLPDWLVPVVYENKPDRLVFSQGAAALPAPPVLPAPLGVPLREGGVLGRGADLLWLERMMLRGSPALVVVGPEGVGKSALLRSYVLWRHRTNGLANAPIWLNCAELDNLSAALVVFAQRLGVPRADPLQVGNSLTPAEVDALADELNRAPRLLVLDDLHRLRRAEQEESGIVLVNQLLARLNQGRSRILMSTRKEDRRIRADLRSLCRLGPLRQGGEDDVAATLVAEALTKAGYSRFPGSPDVVLLAACTRGLPGLIMGIGPYITTASEASRAAALLEERKALIEQGEIARVIQEVVEGL